MALKVKSPELSTTKWADNAARAADLFASEAEAAGEVWASRTAASQDTYGTAIAAPGIKNRFAAGVRRAGAAKYTRKIRDVARDRFGPGVAAARTDYAEGVSPYLSTIAALTLSARKPRGDPANYNRSMEVGKALNSKRLALLGVGG